MAYDEILTSEVDADSPQNEDLWTKVKNNDIAFHAGAGVTSAGLKTTTGEDHVTRTGTGITIENDIMANSQYQFWPQVKQVGGTGSVVRYRVMIINDLVAGGVAISASYQSIIMLEIETAGASGDKSLYAITRRIQASRDFPLVWIRRNKEDGYISGMAFRPEGTGNSPPFLIKKPETEILCMQLKQSPELCEYLWHNFYKTGSWLQQVRELMDMNALIINGEDQPMLAEKTNKTDFLKAFGEDDPEAAPCLYHPDVKLVKFKFDKTKLEI